MVRSGRLSKYVTANTVLAEGAVDYAVMMLNQDFGLIEYETIVLTSDGEPAINCLTRSSPTH